ncbi:MAG: patatin-like phospholipase family protein [Chloroflexota bacterium]
MNFDLVFEGGGAKGMAFVGALQEFESRGHKPGRLLGSSAGAITATLLAAGYSSAEILNALNEKLPDGKSVFSSFLADPGPFDHEVIKNSSIRALLQTLNIPFLPDFLEDVVDDSIVNNLANANSFRNFFSFIELGGWFSANQFTSWMENKLNSGTFAGNPRNFGNMTLQQFYDVTNTDLSVVASDTSAKQMLVLNHVTAPQCPVLMAVRMSMSVPLLWQDVTWQAEWGTYLGRNLHGNSIVDGGLLSNFPIELFLSNLKDVTRVMGDAVSQNILGLLIDEEGFVPGTVANSPLTNTFNITDFILVQRLSRLIDTTLSARDKMVIDVYADMVVRLPAKGYGTTEFDMSETRKQVLIEAGRLAMQHYFNSTPIQSSNTIRFRSSVNDITNTITNNTALKILK